MVMSASAAKSGHLVRPVRRRLSQPWHNQHRMRDAEKARTLTDVLMPVAATIAY